MTAGSGRGRGGDSSAPTLLENVGDGRQQSPVPRALSVCCPDRAGR